MIDKESMVEISGQKLAATIGEQHKGARRVGIVRGVLFLIILLDKQKNDATRRADTNRGYNQII
jgi:hypothetical protein